MQPLKSRMADQPRAAEFQHQVIKGMVRTESIGSCMSSRIAEVLSVLRLISGAAARPISLAEVRFRRLHATKAVASERSITPETVRDACTRQLYPHVKGVAHFDALVHAWLSSGARALETALSHHTVDRTDADAVARFFAERRT